jgi:hypothetical protein
VTLLGLVPAACVRVPPHFALPQLAAVDRAFIPTLEAYTVAPVGGGNSVDVLLNGDQIFPAQLAAIRSARETIRRPSTSGGGQAPDDGSAERLRRSRFVRW